MLEDNDKGATLYSSSLGQLGASLVFSLLFSLVLNMLR